MFIREKTVLKVTILWRLQLQLFFPEWSPRADRLPDRTSALLGGDLAQPSPVIKGFVQPNHIHAASLHTPWAWAWGSISKWNGSNSSWLLPQ